MRRGLLVVSLCAFGSIAGAQSFNIDFNFEGGGQAPESSYGAVGTAGFWNSIFLDPSYDLFDLSGAATSANFAVNSWFGFTHQGSSNWTGNDRVLMNDFFFRASSFTLSGLLNGTYEVIMYGISDQSVGEGGTFTVGGMTQSTAGGPLPSGFELGKTHTIFNSVSVSNGNLDINVQGSVNGMQLRYVGTEAVPEPFTMVLLGGAALAGYRRIRTGKRA